MNTNLSQLAPGARIVVRDAEWLVRRVDTTSDKAKALSVVGLSELVRDRRAVFLTNAERKIEILDPAQTRLVPDASSNFRSSLLYIESLLRQTPPTDGNLYVGHKAAMDMVPYQLDPAIQALAQPRQRILMADAVGLGKTLEAGVLLSELIRRGRGKRILVVTVKSMLTQFQKELWSRFSIPLVRLDSIGLQRVRNVIPTNQNPFFYYDRAIISMDTLKQDTDYRVYLESASWDVIIIDEAHNVAERGRTQVQVSQRAKLAKLLSQRSDTLILLSATPHDGRARSFASLMNMLDPTAIADPDNYGPEDIQGLFIRRFKKDIQGQVSHAFKERRISKAHAQASPAEEVAFNALADLRFARLEQRRSAGELFKTTLEKALFSSPVACLQTVTHRIDKLLKSSDPQYAEDIAALRDLAEKLAAIRPADFAKYRKLVDILRKPGGEWHWKPTDTSDRLVIFTERIETLHFLAKHLPNDLGLRPDQVAVLHGGLPDVDQQGIVEDFGREEAKVRLLLASDVASEGINLHYLAHRMIHFDIPWSLMVFQQRNGRIDRYGQSKTPLITYLLTASEHPRIKGDMRILELLIAKDEEAVKNIGDPSALMGVYDIEEEEKVTAKAMESGQAAEDFARELDQNQQTQPDLLDLLMGQAATPKGEAAQDVIRSMPSLFKDDYAYCTVALRFMEQAAASLNLDIEPAARIMELDAPDDLKYRFRLLPKEIQPENWRFALTDDTSRIQEEIVRSRKDESAWPKLHFLWELHPVVEWINDKVLASFRRHEAPVITLTHGLEPGEQVFLLTGIIPNRRGQPLIQRWFGVAVAKDRFAGFMDLETLLTRSGLGTSALPNPGQADDPALKAALQAAQNLLPDIILKARQWMSTQRAEFEAAINAQLNAHLKGLETLRDRHKQGVRAYLAGLDIAEKLKQSRGEQRIREIEKVFDEYISWVEDTMTTEDQPYLKVVALLRREGA